MELPENNLYDSELFENKYSKLVYSEFIKNAKKLGNTSEKPNLIMHQSELKKACELHPEELSRALIDLTNHNLIKKLREGEYELIIGTPFYYKSLAIYDIESCNEEVSDIGDNFFRSILFGIKEEEIDEEILILLTKIKSNLLEIYRIRLKKRLPLFNDWYNERLKEFKNDNILTLLNSIKEELYYLLSGGFNRKRYELPKEMIKEVAGEYDKAEYKKEEKSLSSAVLSSILIRLLYKDDRLKLFNELEHFGKIKVIKFIYNISREFNPSEISIYSKFWGVTPDFPISEFTENNKREIQELTKFIDENNSEILRNK